MKRTPSLAEALERRDWERAALCLLVGLARALEKLPPDSLEGLLEVVSGAAERYGSRQRARCRVSRKH